MPVTKTKHPDIIFRDGKPSAVILDIDEYEELLKQIDDTDDLAYLKKINQKPEEFISLAYQHKADELSAAGMGDYLANLEEYEEKLASGEIRW